MADGTHIQWTEATWNPVVGCARISEGCDHCYIDRTPPFRMAGRRFNGPSVGAGTGVYLHPERLTVPLGWRKPRRVFVNSLSDLFHNDVPDDFLAQVFAVMAATPQHTYQILTKRPGRMRSFVTDECRCGKGHTPSIHLRSKMDWAATPHSPTYVPGVVSTYHTAPWPLPNVWLGVSVENQRWADIRIPILLDTPAAVRWISAEPLLGPVDLHNCAGVDALEPDWVGGPAGGMGTPHPLLDWVVTGGESGPGARPMHPDWPRSLRDQCATAGVPFFFKQWGEYSTLPRRIGDGYAMADPGVTVANDGTVYQPGDLSFPDGPRYGEAVRAGHDKGRLHVMYRVGNKESGRELDGRTHDDYPTTVPIGASS